MELKPDRSKAKNYTKFKKSPENVKIKGSQDISAPSDSPFIPKGDLFMTLASYVQGLLLSTSAKYSRSRNLNRLGSWHICHIPSSKPSTAIVEFSFRAFTAF